MATFRKQIRDTEVREFTARRFPLDNNWMDGNCYWFAGILTNRFDYLTMGYDPIIGHFVAMDVATNTYYDYDGAHELNATIIPWNTLQKMDPSWAARLIRDCKL